MPGERFHKIGVGLLKKDSYDPYSFAKSYNVLPLEIEEEIFDNSILFKINAPLINGFAYSLRKNLLLDGSMFILNYKMTNTGEKIIRTSEYVHNFLSLNNRDIDASYLLRFSFICDPDGCIEVVNPQNCVKINKNTVLWNSQMETPIFFSQLNPGNLKHCYWELINTKEKIGLRETCMSNISRVNLWGTKHVISPELFHPITLEPGESESWDRKFEFFEL